MDPSIPGILITKKLQISFKTGIGEAFALSLNKLSVISSIFKSVQVFNKLKPRKKMLKSHKIVPFEFFFKTAFQYFY
jgi:hypothetical protein